MLNPRLGGIRVVASVSVTHEQTQYNQVGRVHFLDAVFPKDPLVKLINDHTISHCSVWRSQNVSPYIDLELFTGSLGL